MGSPPVLWWLDDFFRFLAEPYYLALQSAASAYGSNPQAVQTTQVMTKTPRRDIDVGRIRLQFFSKRTLERTPTQAMTNAYAPLKLSTPEATAYDLIRYADRLGGIGRAAETIAPLVTLMRPSELKQVLKIEGETPTAQRLGFVLERLRAPELAKTVQQWLPADLTLVPLVPGIGGTAPEIKRWRVLNNAMEYTR